MYVYLDSSDFAVLCIFCQSFIMKVFLAAVALLEMPIWTSALVVAMVVVCFLSGETPPRAWDPDVECKFLGGESCNRHFRGMLNCQ